MPATETRQTIHASQITPGMTVETLPTSGARGGRRFTVEAVETHETHGVTIYDLHHATGRVTNLSGEYALITTA